MELPMRNVESFVNIGQKLRWMPNQLKTKSLLGSAPNSNLSLNRQFLTPSSLYMTTWTQKKLERPERLIRKDGNWPDLEVALFQWQLAINRQNNTVTG
jgi:hypothetical protein